MLLTITTTHQPASDLGYLLGKHPGRLQSAELSFGRVHVCYPEVSDERCTVAMILDIDPVGLVRRPDGDEGFVLGQYTNDRPYVASSLLAVAIGRVFGQALGGRSKARQELADLAIALETRLPVLPVRGGELLLRGLFEPLGYEVGARRIAVDPVFASWGDSRYFDVTLRHTLRLCDLLRHLAVLIPVLDDEKHYWVGDEEVDTLVRRGEGWLPAHPMKDLIARRYLKHRRSLASAALVRLAESSDQPADDDDDAPPPLEDAIERPMTLADTRMDAVVEVLRANAVRRVLDLGCGEGRLLRLLLRDPKFEEIRGVDVSMPTLERAAARLNLDTMAPTQRSRIELWQGSTTYRDERFSGFDAICMVEVIEHVDASRLPALERVVFEFAAPRVVVVTTPNVEYNVKFETLGDRMRHSDHRFEWTRRELLEWATAVAARHGYAVEIRPIGPVDEQLGAPTQMAVFSR
jgi:3' terminal RNA ribose 2'-O-methyltransferase Hen1